MSIISKLKPEFWDADPQAGPHKSLFNYRRIWRLATLVLSLSAMAPVLLLTFLDDSVTRHSLKSDALLRTARVTSNTRRSLAYFLDERSIALKYIAEREDENAARLREPEELQELLDALKNSFGGFIDLGLIDFSGKQVAYVGPYRLGGKDYSDQEWFRKTLEDGSYTSGVFLGYRDIPHVIAAVKLDNPGMQNDYVLRATLDTERFNQILEDLDLAGDGDAFVVDQRGVLQTPSKLHGGLLSKVDLEIPPYSSRTGVKEITGKDGEDLILGYAYISDTPFIIMVVKRTSDVMKPLQEARLKLLWILLTSVALIGLAILWASSYMVGKIYIADRTRAETLHHMEHTNRMASIGRLAAGVAHEINNPLAIINEKAGLVKDIFSFTETYKSDERLIKNIDSIISSVERCGTITKRLLSFARHIDVRIETIHFKDLAEEVLGFLHKEAEYRSIDVSMDIADDLPEFESDRGKLQQIFLNLVNNAFQAMSDGGKLMICARKSDNGGLRFKVADNGCGIPASDLKRIFEPFFSTKKKRGGTGLGLSITYGLVKEIGGEIKVESKIGQGTTFTIELPVSAPENDKGTEHEDTVG